MRRTGFLASILLLASLGFSQTDTTAITTTRDPVGLALASQAWAKLTGGTQVQDATINATAVWIVGPDREQVPAVLKLKGPSQTRLELNLSAGHRVELQSADADGTPQGAWMDPDGTSHPAPLHNCWIDSAWFFPERLLLAASTDSTVGVSYRGQETLNGATVQHISVWRNVPKQSAKVTALIAHLSAVDVYLDSGSLLPVALRFSAHPDDDAATDIPIEIRYSNYRQIGSLQVPDRITKTMSGSLLLDLRVTDVAVNSGLDDSDFATN